MVFSKIIFIVLHTLVVAKVFGWSHVSRNQFQSFVNKNEAVLVACESLEQVLMFTELHLLIWSHFGLAINNSAVLAVRESLHFQFRPYMIRANIEPDAPATDVRQSCLLPSKLLRQLHWHDSSREASKALEPEWISASTQSKRPLISVDCTAESELCDENGVISYPAIRLFKGLDSVTRYRGPRKAWAWVD
jgi:Thioredoxin